MKTILVVEDDPLIRALEVVTLRRAGYDVRSAEDGVEGTVLFSREFQKFDVLVTDISLPGMLGPEVARFARSVRPDIKVLFASGSMFMEEAGAISSIEGASLLSKPFTAEQLRLAVAALLEGKAASVSDVLRGDQLLPMSTDPLTRVIH